MAHTGRGAQVLTCNYEPFIGHSVNCAAKEHTEHNTELLNHNHLKENFFLCLQKSTRDTSLSTGTCGSEAENSDEQAVYKHNKSGVMMKICSYNNLQHTICSYSAAYVQLLSNTQTHTSRAAQVEAGPQL